MQKIYGNIIHTFFILIDLISNCYETFCNSNFFYFLCLRKRQVTLFQINGPLYIFYGLLCDTGIDSGITWKIIGTASCLTK